MARFSLPRYRRLSDYMSGFFALSRSARFLGAAGGCEWFQVPLRVCWAISDGQLNVSEIPLISRPGSPEIRSWIWPSSGISASRSCTPLLLRAIPRRAISFALVGATGVVIQLLVVQALMGLVSLRFDQALPVAVLTAATTNYLINNALTFRFQRQKGRPAAGPAEVSLGGLLAGPGERGVASGLLQPRFSRPALGQLAGILVVFVLELCGLLALRLEHPLETNERNRPA